MSRFITCSDIIFGYLFPLTIGKKFLKFLSNEEFCAIDCNTRNANKIVGSLIIGLAMISTSLITYFVISENIFFGSAQRSHKIVVIILKSLFLGFYYFNGLFLMPVLYFCITSLIITQINKLNSSLSKGIIHILCILTL